VQHPAAKMLVMACQMQEEEYGDNTNFVLSFGGELLKLAEDLVKNGLHTSEIISGYQRAFDKVPAPLILSPIQSHYHIHTTITLPY
jgi:T-complex protein 1 subunit theta